MHLIGLSSRVIRRIIRKQPGFARCTRIVCSRTRLHKWNNCKDTAIKTPFFEVSFSTHKILMLLFVLQFFRYLFHFYMDGTLKSTSNRECHRSFSHVLTGHNTWLYPTNLFVYMFLHFFNTVTPIFYARKCSIMTLVTGRRTYNIQSLVSLFRTDQ